MDLKAYYQKIRETEAKVAEAFPVMVSCSTQDGGKLGVSTEVSRSLAAKMLVDGKARVATPEEVKAFRKAQADGKRAAEEAEAGKTMQFKVVSVDDVRRLTQDRA